MPAPALDFRRLRTHRNSRNDSFEELTRQLVLADPPPGWTEIENRGPGADGGVEILVRFDGNRVWGWQSKFFDQGFGNSEVGQLRTSFSAALTNYPGLERYTVAVPRNLSGSDEGELNTQRRKWREWKEWAEGEARKDGRAVAVELWDDSYFVRKLQSTDPVYAGMRSYWFAEEVLTQSWFEDKFSTARERIGNRYMADDHVDLGVRKYFDVLLHNDALDARLASLQVALSRAVRAGQELVRHAAPQISTPAAALFGTVQDLQTSIADGGSRDPWAHVTTAAMALRDIVRTSENLHALRRTANERKPAKTESRDDGEWVYDSNTRSSVSDFQRELVSASEVFSRNDDALLMGKPLLVLGEAGSGKTHLLADEVARQLKRLAPAVFIPAKALQSVSQPGRSILDYLEVIDTSFSVWLSALSAAALAAGKDALLAIDGINESASATDWEASLPALLREVSAFPNIRISLSCRTTYVPHCVRPTLDAVRLVHPGFRGSLSLAAKTYLDNHGIERSSAPIFELSGVLNNPLFLTSVVRGLKSEGKTSFPRDLDSLPNILAYWIQSVERSLLDGRFERIQPNDGKVGQVVRALAAEMARQGAELLSIVDANRIGEVVIDLAPPSRPADRIVTRLLEEGILLDFPSAEAAGGKTVSFSFQKFSDYFIAAAILEKAADGNALMQSLLPGGPFAHIFERTKGGWQFEGVRIALLALCPTHFGEELPHLNRPSDLPVTIDEFVASIPLRERKALTTQTVELLERLRRPKDDRARAIEDRDWYDLLVKMATTPEMELNADYLKRYLESMPCAERDATWSYYLVGALDEYGDESTPLQQLVDWAWNAPLQDVDVAQVRLAAQTLALMTSTMDRGVRDRATKALSGLLMKFPAVMPALVDAFSDWDDPYVRERMLAAALAGTLACDAPELLSETAAAVDRMVFAKVPVERHAWTRRWGQLIVERATAREPALDAKLIARAKPPYASEPITEWPSLRDVAVYKDKASSIVRSVVGSVSKLHESTSPGMAGDFGRYTMGAVGHNFSRSPRTSQPPLTRGAEIALVLDEVRALGEAFSSELAKLTELHASLKKLEWAYWKGLIETLSNVEEDVVEETDLPPPDRNKARKKLETAIRESERRLVAKLPSGLADRHRQADPFGWSRAEEIPRFSLGQAQCWVALRSIAQGWSEQRHGSIENGGLNYSYGRHDHQIERVGKKYQHIAFQELVGYLADHHWFLDYDEMPSVLDMLERFKRPSIDPTFLAGEYSCSAKSYDPGGLTKPALAFSSEGLKSDIAWTKSANDLPALTDLFVQRGADGFDWAIVNSFVRSPGYMDEFKSPISTRSGQLGIELVLVPIAQWSELDILERSKVLAARNDIFRHDDSTDMLFGQAAASVLKASAPPFHLDETICGVPFGRVADVYSPKDNEYDHSGVSGERGFFVPKPALLATLGLKPKSPFSSHFVDASGHPAFSDESEGLDEWCVMRWDLLKQFATARNLGVLWRVWLEKDGGINPVFSESKDRPQWSRRDYLGYSRKAADGWKGNMVRYRD